MMGAVRFLLALDAANLAALALCGVMAWRALA